MSACKTFWGYFYLPPDVRTVNITVSWLPYTFELYSDSGA